MRMRNLFVCVNKYQHDSHVLAQPVQPNGGSGWGTLDPHPLRECAHADDEGSRKGMCVAQHYVLSSMLAWVPMKGNFYTAVNHLILI